MLNLRDYQEDAVENVVEYASRGDRRTIVNLPTGTGKTVTALALVVRALSKGSRVLWLAHRDELIAQAAGTFGALAPMLPEPGVVKAERNEHDRQFVLASVQTIQQPKRLEQIRPAEFQFVVYDEAHHAASESGMRILSALDPNAVVLGLTATVERGDGRTLEEAFPGGVCYTLPLLVAIRAGWLVDFMHRYRTIEKLDLDAVAVSGGDYRPEALAEALSAAGVAQETAAAVREFAPLDKRKSLIFTATVKQAQDTAEALGGAAAGVVALHAGTPADERRSILRAFRKGDIRAIANCAILTEGYDEPSADAVVIARPTMSKGLYLQMLGRGLRISPGKSDCMIVDLVGAGKRHSSIQAPILVGLNWSPADVGCAEAAAVAALDDDEAALKQHGEGILPESFKALLRGDGVKPSWAEWAPLPEVEGAFAASCSVQGNREERLMVVVWPDTRVEPAGWRVTCWRDRLELGVRRSIRISATPKPVWRELAIGIGEDILRRAGGRKLANKEAAWRLGPASEKVLAALEKWRFVPTCPMTAGQASTKLTELIATAKLKDLMRGKDRSHSTVVPTTVDDLQGALA